MSLGLAACAASDIAAELASDTPGAALTTPIPVPPGFELAWHDEFDVDGRPNSANWGYESGLVRNQELQWYQPDNARVAGGLLIIEGRRERVQNATYTSSSLLTRGKQAWRYGRFEMRARIPTAAGLWPAWWTLGTAGEWPSNGEIDIMEFYQGKLLANVACGTTTRWQAKWDGSARPLSALDDPAWSSKFHVWRMDWTAEAIELSVDGLLLNSTRLDDMLNPDGKSPFRAPHYMLVNLAIGGNNGGDPSKTPFPQRLEVDYIRVFQRPADRAASR